MTCRDSAEHQTRVDSGRGPVVGFVVDQPRFGDDAAAGHGLGRGGVAEVTLGEISLQSQCKLRPGKLHTACVGIKLQGILNFCQDAHTCKVNVSSGQENYTLKGEKEIFAELAALRY